MEEQDRDEQLPRSACRDPNEGRTTRGSLLLQVRGYHHPCRGSPNERIIARLGLATTGMAMLKLIWKTNNSSTSTKIKLFKGLVLAILIYDWSLNADTEPVA